jgi:hypothetical protein
MRLNFNNKLIQMKIMTLVLATASLLSSCSTLTSKPLLSQEQIQTKRQNLTEGFKYFANKRIVIVDGDSSFDEFELTPLDGKNSAEYTFYKLDKGKQFKYTLIDCEGGKELLGEAGLFKTTWLSCNLHDKYENRKVGSVFLMVQGEDYTWKDGRIIPTHKTVHSKKGDITVQIGFPTRYAFFGYTEYAIVKFKN